MQVACGSCQTVLDVPPGVPQIVCPKCSTPNQVPVMAAPVMAQPINAGGAAVAQQPGAWLSLPQGYNVPSDVPSGLEVLAMVDGLMINQQTETLEAVAQAFGIGYEGKNKYKISDKSGMQVYHAVEETGFCWRCCCGSLRPAHIKVFDNVGREVMSMQRSFRYCPCAWAACCLEDVKVYHGPKDEDKLIGKVTQPCCGGWFSPTLNVEDASGNRELSVVGPWCIGECCGSTFDVNGANDVKVGEVTKLGADSFKEFAKESLTDADRFTINFPQDLKVETKATSLVALLIVDFLFFESGGSASADVTDGSFNLDLCTCYCFGCPCPCSISCGGNSGDGDGGGGDGAPVNDEMDR